MATVEEMKDAAKNLGKKSNTDAVKKRSGMKANDKKIHVHVEGAFGKCATCGKEVAFKNSKSS